MMRFYLILIILSLLTLSSVEAQKYPFRTYSIENGLSESVVNDIIQDEKGFIWVATGYGLNRFNGYEFESFYRDNGLNDNKVYALMQDVDNRIWIGTGFGLNYLEGDSIYYHEKFSPLDKALINDLFQDSEGNIWVATDGSGAWKIDQDFNLVHYTTVNGLVGNRVRDIVEDRNGVIWFGTRSGLSALENDTFRSYTDKDGLPESRIRDLLYLDSDRLLIATRNGIAIFDGEKFENLHTDHGLVNNRVMTLELDDKGIMWIGTEEGLSAYDGENFRNFTIQNGLANNLIYDVFHDENGNIWIGTYGGGINLYLGDYFENYTGEDGLTNNLITSVQETENGNKYIATFGGGLMLYNGNNFDAIGQSEGLNDNRIFTLSKFDDGNIWAGTQSGIGQVRGKRVISLSESDFPYRKVRGIYESSNGDIWYSTYGDGAIRYDGKEYRQFTDADGLPSNTIMEAAEDKEGNIWFATYGGASKFNGESFENFSIQDGIPNNGVIHLMVAQDGAIWFSTFGGVARYKNGEIENITEKNGLPDPVSYFIHQSEDGLFWIGTKNGVVRLDYEKFKNGDSRNLEGIRVIQREEGLVGNELNSGAVFEDSDGKLWFGSVDGLSVFYPDRFIENDVEPDIYITAIRSSGREYNLNDLLRFSHNRSFIEVDYVGLDYKAPQQITYEYRIKGIDPDWQTTKNRNAKYPSLPAGDYRFEVRARTANGLWSPYRASIDFTVTPPFWLRWWFIGLNLGLIGGLIYLFYNYWRISKMVDIERMRVRIASDLHDDVGASLTEIALQSDFLQATNMDEEYKKSLNQIGKQSRYIVNALDDIVWSIDARNDTLGDFTDRMQDYINTVLESKNMMVKYDFDDLNMNNRLPVDLKENLYLIFKEAANNIAKYSNGDQVDIQLKTESGDFEMIIRDNGRVTDGIKKTGQGLRNMEMRANRIGANIEIKNSEGFTIVVKGNINAKN